MSGEWTRDAAVQTLADCYNLVLRAFITLDSNELRLCPLGGGINAGSMADCIPQITIEALDKACKTMDGMNGAWAAGKNIKMCIFGGHRYQDFLNAQAGRHAEQPPRAGLPGRRGSDGRVDGSAERLVVAHMDDVTARNFGIQKCARAE